MMFIFLQLTLYQNKIHILYHFGAPNHFSHKYWYSHDKTFFNPDIFGRKSLILYFHYLHYLISNHDENYKIHWFLRIGA